MYYLRHKPVGSSVCGVATAESSRLAPSVHVKGSRNFFFLETAHLGNCCASVVNVYRPTQKKCL